MADFTVITHNPEQTRKLGKLIGRLAQGGDIYLMTGNLGTGKTHLVQGIAFGLGIKDYACSPSFMIAREYQGRLNLYHMDLYRLDQIEEIADLGLDEYFRSDSVCAIEWAEKGSGILPLDNLSIKLQHTGDDSRQVTFSPQSNRYEELVNKLAEILARDEENKWN